jgi:LysR family transcriptional regulator for bpeEF and oprC
MDRLRQILIAVRVADVGSFAKAAASLRVTPPAVSHAVAELERELHVPLFYRTTRQLTLTEDGYEFCRRGREILAQVKALEASTVRDRTRLVGTLRIGLGVSVARHIIMPRLADFMNENPGLEVECRLRLHVKEMHAEALDVLLRVGEPADSAIIANRLCQVRYGIYGAPSYLKALGTPAHPRDLARHRCLIFHPAGWATKPLDTWAFERGRAREVAKLAHTIVSDEREGLITAAIAGTGLVRAGLFDPATIASGHLQRVLGDWTCSGAPSLYAVYRKTPRPVPKIAAFLEFAEKATAAFDPEALTVIHGADERAQPEGRSARVVVRRSSA